MVLHRIRDYFGIPRGYQYFDTPDGEDCGKKIWFLTKEAAIHGPLISAYYIIGYVRPKGFVDALVRVPYITLPLMGMGAGFAATTCMAANFRHKDDQWNYLLGGWTVAIIFGAWRRSIKQGFRAALPLSIFLPIRKNLWMHGNENYGNKGNPFKNFFWTVRKDFSLIKDPGRKWKISPDEVLIHKY